MIAYYTVSDNGWVRMRAVWEGDELFVSACSLEQARAMMCSNMYDSGVSPYEPLVMRERKDGDV